MWTYCVLFLWSFLAASVLPLSVEAYYVYVVTHFDSWMLPCFVAGLGNVLGGLTVFYLGWKGGELALKKLSEKNIRRYERASHLFHRYGSFILILSWVPILGDILIAVAGGLKADIGWSVFWISVGKYGRFILLGMLTLGVL